MRNAHIMGELSLYLPSKFFFPFRQSMPMGEKFRGFKGIWVCSLASFLFVLHGCLNSLYKPSKKGLSSITKMGEIESAWLPPCVVLVINDNPYGLMFTLRYSYTSCPWEIIGVHVLDSSR